MPEEWQQDDVVSLAVSLLNVYGVGDSPIRDDFFARVDEPIRPYIELALDTDDPRALAQWLNLLKLSVDAAAVAVLYVDAYGHHAGDDIDRAALLDLGAQNLVGLELIELADGSILSRFKISPKLAKIAGMVLGVVTLAGLAVKYFVAPMVGELIMEFATLAEAGVLALTEERTGVVAATAHEKPTDQLATVDADALTNVGGAQLKLALF